MSQASKIVSKKRKELGISQARLCRALGYSTPQFLSNFERGLCSMPIKKLKKISSILDIPPGAMKQAIANDLLSWLSKKWGRSDHT